MAIRNKRNTRKKGILIWVIAVLILILINILFAKWLVPHK